MNYTKLNPSDKEKFNEDGFLLIPSFFNKEEVDLLYRMAKSDTIMAKKSHNLEDKEGLQTKLSLWYSLDDSIYSMVARSERLVSGAELLLGNEVGHYHSKLMQKEPKVGGAWEWHQDYGYWYREGFLFPDMLSVLTALTPSTKENGCLQVIKGSHKMGRIDHGFAGEQVGANMERVEAAEKLMDLVYVEMSPGDTLFFHCNLLHRSDSNRSDSARWSLISAYNNLSNKPIKGTNVLSSYTPISVVPDSTILETEPVKMSENADFKKV